MDFVGSVSCSQCGSPVGSSSGRCPFCGAELSEAKGAQQQAEAPSKAAPVGYSEGALRYNNEERFSASRRSTGRTTKPLVLAGAGFAFVLAGLAAFSFLRSRVSAVEETSSAPPPPPKVAVAAPDEVTIADPRHVDPGELSPPVQYRARAFSPSARLLSIAASPVGEQGVDLTAPHAQVVYTYFSGKQDPALAADAGVGRFIVTIEEGGALQATFPATPGDAKAVVDEPLCVFSAAIRAGRASGLPAEGPLDAVYQLDTTLGRAVWKLSAPGQKELIRYIDGKTCAIVTKR